MKRKHVDKVSKYDLIGVKINIKNRKEDSKVAYLDITKKMLNRGKKFYNVKEQQFFIDDNGNRYDVDNKHIILNHTNREKEVANILGKLYGGKVSLQPVVLFPLRYKDS